MQFNDRAAFLEVVVGFAELKGKQLSVPALELYWNAMQDWELADFRKAAQYLLKTCEFMPTPKDFEDLRKAQRPTSGEAWSQVLSHLQGAYRYGGISPDIDRAVHACGGYRALAMMDTSQLPWQAKRFEQHYADMQDVADHRVAIGGTTVPQLQSDARPAEAAQLPAPPTDREKARENIERLRRTLNS